MRFRRGAALAALFSSATLATCVYPTEHDSSVHVSLTPLRILLRGTTAVRRATAWQRGSATASGRVYVPTCMLSTHPSVASPPPLTAPLLDYTNLPFTISGASLALTTC